MKDVGIVSGDKEMAIPVYFGKTIVYVHTDIKQVPRTDEDGNIIEDDENSENLSTSYTYHEYQYTYDEYLKIQNEENLRLKEELSNAQLALLELYEGMEE